jgi:hypothetical protein
MRNGLGTAAHEARVGAVSTARLLRELSGTHAGLYLCFVLWGTNFLLFFYIRYRTIILP